MKAIIGLGNPGKEYSGTRHNTGFLAVDQFSQKFNFAPFTDQNNFAAEITRGKVGKTDIILAKPLIFMNNSGQAVQKICRFYKINKEKNLLIIHDDADLPLGKWKTTDDSSSAGHKGVQNIIDFLGGQKFHRLRIGIEARENKKIPPTDDYVLQNFSPEEHLILEQVLAQIIEEIKKFTEE